jgi:hypothetical protein
MTFSNTFVNLFDKISSVHNLIAFEKVLKCLKSKRFPKIVPLFSISLKGQCHEIFGPPFFCQTIPTMRLMKGLKLFRI